MAQLVEANPQEYISIETGVTSGVIVQTDVYRDALITRGDSNLFLDVIQTEVQPTILVENVVQQQLLIQGDVYQSSLLIYASGDPFENAFREFSYDVDGNLSLIEFWDSPGKNMSLGTKSFTYVDGNLSQIETIIESDGSTSIKTITYDLEGNLSTISIG